MCSQEPRLVPSLQYTTRVLAGCSCTPRGPPTAPRSRPARGARRPRIEAQLARRHLGSPANPSRLALFDLTSSLMEGSQRPLAARGYSRDGKKGKPQIEYGLPPGRWIRPEPVHPFGERRNDRSPATCDRSPKCFCCLLPLLRQILYFSAGIPVDLPAVYSAAQNVKPSDHGVVW